MRRVAVMHELAIFPLDLFQAVRDFCEIVWILDNDLSADTRTVRMLHRLGDVVDITGLGHDDAARLLASASLDGIVTFDDAFLPRVAELAERLGLRFHTPELAGALADKARQRAALAGLPGAVAFVPVSAGASQESLADALDRVGLPAVLKRRSGTGSVGMRFIRDESDIRALGDDQEGHVLEEYLPDRDGLPEWVASYVSVETVVADGVPHHVAVSGRFPTASSFRETGNFVPALIDEETRREVLAIADEVIAALDVRDSLLHTEIKLTPDGPRLLEVNGRIGGSTSYVLGEVTDIDLLAVAVRVAVGLPLDLPEPVADPVGVGFRLMVQPPEAARRVVRIDGVDDIAALPEVHMLVLRRSPGDDVDWREGTASHVLSIRGAARDHEQLADLLRRVHETVRIEYDAPSPTRDR